MPKALCISGMVVAALLLLIFGLDMILGFPFGVAEQTSYFMHGGVVVSSAILGYLSWSAWREQV